MGGYPDVTAEYIFETVAFKRQKRPSKSRWMKGHDMGPSLKVYGAKTCGDTKRARQFLDEHDIPYSWFDVDEDREALSLIKSVNNGNRTTPTIFFEDGSIEFEPSNEALARKLGVSN